MNIRRVATIFFALLYAVFVIQNTQMVEVRFLFWSTQISRALVLAGTFILGFVSGRLWSWIRRKQEEATEAEGILPAEGEQLKEGGKP
ncbi:MAG: LapA family protein [Deltaproteobacteria bacterium]|nr:LapA family protein [Deltaproteobacteria bacterium]